MIANFLCACADCTWWFQSSIVSLFLFGESAYPTEDSAE